MKYLNLVIAGSMVFCAFPVFAQNDDIDTKLDTILEVLQRMDAKIEENSRRITDVENEGTSDSISSAETSSEANENSESMDSEEPPLIPEDGIVRKEGLFSSVYPVISGSLDESALLGRVIIPGFPFNSDIHRNEFASGSHISYHNRGYIKIRDAGIHTFSIFIEASNAQCAFDVKINNRPVIQREAERYNNYGGKINVFTGEMDLAIGDYEFDSYHACYTYSTPLVEWDLKILGPNDFSPRGLGASDFYYEIRE